MLDDAGVLHERVAYSPYGRGEHRWGGDVNGDGSVDNYDLLAIATAAGEAIGDAGYQADLDVDRDGTILPTGVTEDLVRVQAFGSRVAVPTGWISDPADTAGPDNEVGYAGYRFNCEDQIYCVRFRHYSPRLGRWIERDPAGYVDGMGLYQYVGSRPINYIDSGGLEPVDPSPRMAPLFRDLNCTDLGRGFDCKRKCDKTKSGLFAALCRAECEKKGKRFEDWYARQRDLSWISQDMPDCPCSISDSGCNPDTDKWKKPTDELWGYHAGAKWCMRSKTVAGSANQCCYDSDGMLITHGEGSGSADRKAVDYYLRDFRAHKVHDMDPADSAIFLDGGTWGCYSEAYLQVRPQIGSEKCPQNP